MQVDFKMLGYGVHDLANGYHLQPVFGADTQKGDSPHNSSEILKQRLARAADVIRQDPQLQVRHTQSLSLYAQRLQWKGL